MALRAQGRRKSNFPAETSVLAGASFDYFVGGVNSKISFTDLLTALGATGTIVQDGAVTGTPILDPVGSVNHIRNIEDGSGIQSSVSPENGLTLEHNFALDAVGVPLSNNFTLAQPVFRSLVAGPGVNISGTDNEIQISASAVPASTKTVVVNSLSDFPAPVGNVITLTAETEYLLTNDINAGPNRFVMAENTVVRGADSSVITLTYTGVGDMFTAVDVTFKIDSITLHCADGRVFNATDSTNTKFIRFFLSTVITCDEVGLLSGYAGILINTVGFSDVKTSGITLGGNAGVFYILNCFIIVTDGSFVDLSAFTVSTMTVSNSVFILVAGTSFGITGTGSTNIVSIATMVNCRANGAGSLLNGIATEDDKWQFALNDDVRDTRTDALIVMHENATVTIIAGVDTPVLIAGTWDASIDASQFTIDAAGRATYTGVKPIRLPITANPKASMVSGTTKAVSFYVAVNGAIVDQSAAHNIIGTVAANTAIVYQHTFEPGDFVEVFVENNDDAVNILVDDINFRIN